MNQTQTQTGLAAIVAFFAGLLAGKGVFGFDTATWTQILGGAAGLAATIWTAIATRKTAMVTQVAQMPEVKAIKLDPFVAGSKDLDSATPENVKIAS